MVLLHDKYNLRYKFHRLTTEGLYINDMLYSTWRSTFPLISLFSGTAVVNVYSTSCLMENEGGDGGRLFWNLCARRLLRLSLLSARLLSLRDSIEAGSWPPEGLETTPDLSSSSCSCPPPLRGRAWGWGKAILGMSSSWGRVGKEEGRRWWWRGWGRSW